MSNEMNEMRELAGMKPLTEKVRHFQDRGLELDADGAMSRIIEITTLSKKMEKEWDQWANKSDDASLKKLQKMSSDMVAQAQKTDKIIQKLKNYHINR